MQVKALFCCLDNACLVLAEGLSIHVPGSKHCFLGSQPLGPRQAICLQRVLVLTRYVLMC